MKISNNSLFAIFLSGLLLFSCTTESPSTTETTEESETMEEKEEMMEPKILVENDTFTIKVLKDGIKSPMKQLTTTMGEKEIAITYGSPSVKGRTIFGDLVPYGQVWRTGANEATTFTTNANLEIGGKTLPAGTYGLFTIPEKEDWTIIFNETSEQWGSYDYDESKDVLRTSAKSSKDSPVSETMEFMVEDDQIILAWDKVKVPFAVK